MIIFSHMLHGILPLVLGMAVTAPNPERVDSLKEWAQRARQEGLPVMEKQLGRGELRLAADFYDEVIRLEGKGSDQDSLASEFYAEEETLSEKESKPSEEDASVILIFPQEEEGQAALIGNDEVVEVAEEAEGTSEALELTEESTEVRETQTEESTEVIEVPSEETTQATEVIQTLEGVSENPTGDTRALNVNAGEETILLATDIKPRKKLKKARKELPESVQIEVEPVLQMPELPTGCESVALTIALHGLGFEIGKTEIADHYLVYDSYNYVLGYVGNPYSSEGAGVFPPGMVRTANRFFKDKDSGLRAYDATGYRLTDLLCFVAIKKPVLLWVTISYGNAYMSGYGLDYQGKTYEWYQGEHCVALTGYNLKERTVTLCDPLEGKVVKGMDEIQALMDTVGSYAVVFYEEKEAK